jgi:aspartokinase
MRPVSVITVVGSRLGEDHRLTAQLLSALEGIHILALAQGPSHNNLSVVIEPEDADDALTNIHQLILAQ